MSQFVVGPEAGDEDTGPVTIYDLQPGEKSKVRVRALPRLTQQAVRVAWAAGRSEFLVSTLLQIIGGGGIVLLLLLGHKVCKHSSRHCKLVSHSLQSHPGRSRSPALLASSHLSPQCSANVNKSSAT